MSTRPVDQVDAALDVGTRRRAWLADARLYLVIDARPGGESVEPIVRAALRNGVDIVQLRDKQASEPAIVRTGRALRRLCDAYDALLIVNDRPDLALAAGADGVHLGQDDGSPAAARRMMGDEYLIGRSTHTPEQADQAEADAAVDYFATGPVYATPTKPGRPAAGFELVAHAAGHAHKPHFAIGGIDTGNVHDVLAAGATRVVVVRAIRDAGDPGAATAQLRAALDDQ